MNQRRLSFKFLPPSPPHPRLKTEGHHAGAATRRIKSIFVKRWFSNFGWLLIFISEKTKKRKSFLSVPCSQLSDAWWERGGDQSRGGVTRVGTNDARGGKQTKASSRLRAGGITGPTESHLMLDENTSSKIIRDKNKCFFHTSAKKTSFLFLLFSFLYKQACHTKGGGEYFCEEIFQSSKKQSILNIRRSSRGLIVTLLDVFLRKNEVW